MKKLLHPVRVFALVTYNGVETADLENMAIDKATKITVNFTKKVDRRSKLICSRRRLCWVWSNLL